MKYFLLLCISYLYLNANAHVFVYHRFGDIRYPSTNTSLEELEREFKYFKDNGYKAVSMSQIIEKLDKKEDIPDNWVAFNIDDTFTSFYENALPIFKKYNYPFTLFVYVEATQKRYKDFMSWEQIKEASKYGEIGLHSYSHGHLTHFSKKEVYDDTKKAYDIFVDKLGFEPKGYAYPFGEYNDTVKNEIKKFGFDYIVNQSNGSVNKNSDKYNLHRVALVGKTNIKEKLRYKTLEASWIEPKEYPKDGILKRVKVKVDPKYKNMKVYLSTYGWQDVKVKDGIIDINLNKKLKLTRNRVAISPNYYTISTKLLIK